MSEPIIATQGLTHAYGDIIALSDVALAVPPGTIGLVGANGAGKTTLLKIMLGILAPVAGTVEVLGFAVDGDPIEVRSRVGYMPEGPCLPKDQTAADFVGYAAEIAGLPSRAARQRSSEILSLVGLYEERFRLIGEFSTGMAQRTKLAQALVHAPELVLLDEPTAGLDPEGREEMLDLIERIGEFGINAVVSSHVLTDIERTCDWVVMLDGGRVLRSEPLQGLSDTGVVEVELFDDPARLAALLSEQHGAEVATHGNRIEVRTAGDAYLLVRDAAAATGASIRRLGTRSTTLEDIFLEEGAGDG